MRGGGQWQGCGVSQRWTPGAADHRPQHNGHQVVYTVLYEIEPLLYRLRANLLYCTVREVIVL